MRARFAVAAVMLESTFCGASIAEEFTSDKLPRHQPGNCRRGGALLRIGAEG